MEKEKLELQLIKDAYPKLVEAMEGCGFKIFEVEDESFIRYDDKEKTYHSTYRDKEEAVDEMQIALADIWQDELGYVDTPDEELDDDQIAMKKDGIHFKSLLWTPIDSIKYGRWARENDLKKWIKLQDVEVKRIYEGHPAWDNGKFIYMITINGKDFDSLSSIPFNVVNYILDYEEKLYNMLQYGLTGKDLEFKENLEINNK